MISHDIRAHAIARYMARGFLPIDQARIGFELEHFVVDRHTRELVPYLTDHHTGKPGVEFILERLAAYYDTTVLERSSDGTENLIGLSRAQAAITLEPGAQVEISIGPVARIVELEQLYRDFRREIDPILDEYGYMLLEYGYHPTACAFEIPMIPKDRYAYMDEYFQHTGAHGICMMRASAATQTSIDFTDEHDAIRKLRVANALGPFFAFITDNSPVYESVNVRAVHDSMCDNEHAATQRVSPRSGLAIPDRMARITNWDDCDPHRCLVPPAIFDEDYDFMAYASGLLKMPAIFTVESTAEHDKKSTYVGFRPHEDILAFKELDDATVELILSLCFYDVRLKNYLEIRQADSMPLEYVLAFVALVKGIFYQEAALSYYAEQFTYLEAAAIAFAKSALRRNGYEAIVYQRPAAEWLDGLIAHAEQGLSADERIYLMPLAQLIQERRTLLDMHRPDTGDN